LIWQVDLAGPVLSTACIVDGHIWIGSGDGHFYCFGPKNA
jgi:outer membrane protein assembly factor BamB